jgi:hypothetical protein
MQYLVKFLYVLVKFMQYLVKLVHYPEFMQYSDSSMQYLVKFMQYLVTFYGTWMGSSLAWYALIQLNKDAKPRGVDHVMENGRTLGAI